jgi:hypothetical protein
MTIPNHNDPDFELKSLRATANRAAELQSKLQAALQENERLKGELDSATNGRVTVSNMLEACMRERDSLAASNKAEREELEYLRATANISVCVWCGFKGPKDAESMADHMLSCDKHPVQALMAIKQMVEDEYHRHSYLTPEGERMPRNEIGQFLVRLFPPLSRLESLGEKG